MRAARTIVVAIAVAASLPGAAAAAEPQVGDLVVTPVASTAPDADVVAETYVRQYEPLPDSLQAPSECDWLGYLRFRHAEGPERAADADAVLVAMPGNLGGAQEFDVLARNVIAQAAARNRYVEVWALDRRSNCLEDRTGIVAATEARDWSVALDYYWRGKEIDGRRFEGFKTSDEVPYLAEFGVARTVEDWYAVMARGIPDPEARRRKVFCGGHSHGGFLTGAFATWDFDGDPETAEDAGYNQCAGYFALDTAVTNSQGIPKWLGPAGDVLGAAVAAGVRSGAISRMEGTYPLPVTPETFTFFNVAALAAYHQPDAEADLQRVPHTRDIDHAMGLFFSRNAAVFAAGTPTMRDFRLTNEAAFAALVDDNSQPLVQALHVSLGTFDGGPVVDKDFPVPNALRDVPFAGQALFGFTGGLTAAPGSTRLMIPETPHGPLYRWRPYDRVGEPDAPKQLDSTGHPYTSPASEISDVHQFARVSFEGPVDQLEHYMPQRLLLETVAFLTGGRGGDLSGAKHEDGPARRPYLEILGGESAGTTIGAMPIEPGVEPRRRVILPGYNHLDVVAAAARQNDGEPEGSSASLTDFVLDVSGAAERAPTRLVVRPGRVRAGRTVRLRFQVRSADSACRSGMTIRFAGRSVRTRRRGGAVLRMRLRRAGAFEATARKPGCRPGSATVRVVGQAGAR